jgi:hypothetical protein
LLRVVRRQPQLKIGPLEEAASGRRPFLDPRQSQEVKDPATT